jgi:xylulokinase
MKKAMPATSGMAFLVISFRVDTSLYLRSFPVMWFLGMDIGTGGTRAVLVNEKGIVVSSAASEHAPFRTAHPGWAEQDPEDWWRAAQEAIRGALAAAPTPAEPIAAVGLTGQMHGAVMLDKDGGHSPSATG